MAKTASRTIILRGVPIYNEDGVASEAITPGHLVEGVTSLAKHSDPGGAAARTFALERDEFGDDIDEPYAIDDVVKVGSFAPGTRVNAWITSGAVSAGGFLESAGDGTLKAYSAGVRVARALESGGGGGGQRLPVEIY